MYSPFHVGSLGSLYKENKKVTGQVTSQVTSNGIARVGYLWTMFMISLLFGGAYALLLERSLAAPSLNGLTVLQTLSRALLLP